MQDVALGRLFYHAGLLRRLTSLHYLFITLFVFLFIYRGHAMHYHCEYCVFISDWAERTSVVMQASFSELLEKGS